MQRFTLSEEGFEDIRRRTVLRGVGSGLAIAVVVGVVFAFVQQAEDALRSILIFAVVFGIFFGVSFMGMRRSVRRLRDFWDAFELNVGEDRLTLKTSNADKVTLKRREVVRIGETPDEGLWVSTGDQEDDMTIHIPKEINEYSRVRAMLGQWQRIETIDAPGGRVPVWAWLVMFAIAYALILLINLWWVVVPVGLVLLGVGGFFTFSILRSPNADSTLKIGTVVIGLMMLSVAFRIGFVIWQTFGGGAVL